MRGGLVPGEQQQDAHRHQLVVGQAIAVVVERDQLGQQVALRRRAACRHQLAEHARHLARGGAGALVFSGTSRALPMKSAISSDKCLSRASSSRGAPSMSMITSAGSGMAKSPMKSNSLFSGI